MTSIRTRSLSIILVATALLLSIPLVAMQFTQEVNWSFTDFIVMGLLLLGTGLAGELVLQGTKTLRYRIVWLAIVLIGFLAIWSALALGW